MKSRITRYAFLALIGIFILAICVYGVERKVKDIYPANSGECEFNITEQRYMDAGDTINIYVGDELRCLEGEGDSGFLREFVDVVFEPVDMDIRFTEDRNEADCVMAIVTEKVRRANENVEYTSPLFQIEGSMFVREGTEGGGSLTGTLMADRIENGEDTVKFDGRPVSFKTAETAEEAVDTARKEGLDFILGDKTAVTLLLGEDSDYLPAEKAIYSKNVCLITDDGEEALYGILNKCIHAADEHELVYELGRKWLDGNGPVYMNETYDDLYMLILVLITALMITFFIYYSANKNLYDELNDRMEQLTESKKELKTTFNGVGYYLAELDLEGNIQDINKAFYEFVNVDTANRKIWDVLELDEESVAKLREMVESGGSDDSAASVDIESKRQVFATDIFPVENARGAVDKLLFVAKDVTGERIAERQLLQDNKMIAVGQLAAGVAHEIRNPLGIIRNYCYVLKTMDDEDAREMAVAHIEKAVDRSGAIINNLLNFSRIPTSAGMTVDIKEHIDSIITLNINMLKKKNIGVSVICPESVKTFIVVESLDMILINLITNAVDAMDDNGNLTIKVVKYKERFEIDVADTGSGIEEDILNDIFNPFFTTKGNNRGNGLGLYIVYNETDKLNGKIEVESKVGEGTLFRLTLPLRSNESEVEGNDQGKSKDTRG